MKATRLDHVACSSAERTVVPEHHYTIIKMAEYKNYLAANILSEDKVVGIISACKLPGLTAVRSPTGCSVEP